MFEIGDKIVYSGVGICTVEAIGPAQRPLPGADPARPYYTLRPLHDNSVVYTPVDTTVFMRPVMSCAEARALLASLPQLENIQLPGGDHRQAAEHYRAIMHTCAGDQLLRLLKTLSQRQRACRTQGKALGKVDRQYQQMAEKFLYDELAEALEMSVEQVTGDVRALLAAE